eukprot:6661999-Heterocapsa_arctica.AAC.1
MLDNGTTPTQSPSTSSSSSIVKLEADNQILSLDRQNLKRDLKAVTKNKDYWKNRTLVLEAKLSEHKAAIE